MLTLFPEVRQASGDLRAGGGGGGGLISSKQARGQHRASNSSNRPVRRAQLLKERLKSHLSFVGFSLLAAARLTCVRFVDQLEMRDILIRWRISIKAGLTRHVCKPVLTTKDTGSKLI